ncbi:MAG: hypothetical protein KDB01_03305, partial [Planctomycetaceae bacterium]|nr:hypothetical protein [Planctomycetaceae bacterium]
RSRPHRSRINKFWTTAAGCSIDGNNPPGFQKNALSIGTAGTHHHKPTPLNPVRYSTPFVRTREVKGL